MGWRLQINYDDGTSELVDEIFETEEDAQFEFDICLESSSTGRTVLELAGEDYVDTEIEDCDIWEE